MSRPDLSKIKAIIFDLDGVVYFGSRPASGAVETLKQLRSLGYQIVFATNNSAKSRRQIRAKLNKMGIACSMEEVFTSGYATAHYLKLKLAGQKSKVMVLGSVGLKSEFKAIGFNLVEGVPAGYLVVGFDKQFNYQKICRGLDALLAGARFVACNRVANFPGEGGRLIPGCGAMVGALEAAAGKKADIEVGKPNPFFLKMIANDKGLKTDEMLVVGDSPEIEIAMARRFGSPSVLLRQGKSISFKNQERPDYIIKHLSQLVGLLIGKENR